MTNIWVVAIPLIILFTFIFWKLTNGHLKKEYGDKMWKQGTTQLYYWQAALYISFGITMLILFLLNQAKLLSF